MYSPKVDGLPFETTTLEAMRRRLGDRAMELPGHVPFHVVIICT